MPIPLSRIRMETRSFATLVEIVILPPSLMADALERGSIDGYCVGEPWNTLAQSRGSGQILATKNDIWASSPE